MIDELKRDAAYDEIGGEIKPGDLIRVQEFKPPFFLVRCVRFEVAKNGEAYMEISAEPLKLPVSLGKMHNGLVRVVDPESDKLAARLNKLAERLNEAADEAQPRRRETIKIDEHGKRVAS